MVRASWALACLLHALKCDRSTAVPGVGSATACPVRLPCSVTTDSEIQSQRPATVRNYAFSQWKATVVHSSDSWGTRSQTRLPPVCFVTTQHLKHTREGGKGGVRYESGESQELGFLWFSETGWTCTYAFFCFVDFCLTLTWIYIYYIYILP